VIKCSLKQSPEGLDTKKFFEFIKLIFSTRRKMLTSSLKAAYSQEHIYNALELCSIDSKSRPEQLSLKSLILLFQHLNS
jgi:16S rRNA A1518/A1519 N6-dimethyltransferase RsmA/KsgA/DIM1 with predicted DNA glycosylase/AP lyase activity